MALSEEQRKKAEQYFQKTNESKNTVGDYLRETTRSSPSNSLVSKLTERISTAGKNRLSNVKDSFSRSSSMFDVTGQGPQETALQVAGQGAGLVNDVIGAGMSAVGEGLNKIKPGLTGDIAKSAANAIIPGSSHAVDILKTPVGQQGLEKIKGGMEMYSSWRKENPRAAADLEGVVNIAGLLPTGKAGEIGIKAVGEGAEAAAKAAKGIAETGFKTTQRATEKVMKKVGTPAPTPLKAAGEILQGETDDVARGVKGLSTLDTEGVKTFKDLGVKIKSKITELARQVDDDLNLDETKTILDNLGTSAKTKAGTVVTTNPVKTALGQLEELYIKTGDAVGAQDIKELLQTAKASGLTKAEVNDIARLYGQEFGEKAFSKMGDPLTSVNAQMYENTRKSLKEVARAGIGGEAAKSADAAMSTLYDTQRMVKKNIEAVNKLQQRIRERGLLEKIGHGVAKYGDLLTGGTVRGFIGGLLPRGAGYKIMNALDLEESLAKNLKILQDAIKSNSDKEIEKILKNLSF
jgi:hypothetical protein